MQVKGTAFDDAVAHISASKPEPQKTETKNNWHVYASYQDLYRAVDYTALVYVFFKITRAYMGDDKKSGTLFFVPSFITQGIRMSNFTVAVCMIFFKTFFYKTIAKAVLACGEYDFFDVGKIGYSKIKHFVW